MRNELFIVTPFFNPFRFKSRVRLYEQFKREMLAAGVKLLTVEAAFGDHPFEVTKAGDEWSLQFRTDSLLWHKERLINLGLEYLYVLYPEAWNFGWYDADITFVRRDWVAQTIRALMHHDVIQPFSQAIFLNKEEVELWHCESTLSCFLNRRGFHQRPPLPLHYLMDGHPGLAWCATKRALDCLGGLYDECAAGSGDTVMANCLKGGWNVFLPVSPTGGMARSMERWAKRCERHIKGNIGYVPGALLHHWHGPSEKRGYEKRWSILAFHDFDPHLDIERDTNGLWRWSGTKPKLRDDLRLSLSGRNEDE